MNDPRDDPFVPMSDSQGRVTGIMDRMTAEYLASTGPNPTQASLDDRFAGATKARLLAARVDENRVFRFDVLRAETSDPSSLSELREALRIVENPDSFGHMLTMGDHRLELWAADQCLATFSVLGWVALRWESVWKHDAFLVDRLRFERWLSAHGVADAREDREQSEQRAAEARLHRDRWERAMPPCLRPLWPHGFGPYGDDIAAAREQLAADVPDVIERARLLYLWFGSGAGPWSGYPSYESAAERLLVEYPVELLIRAAVAEGATDTQLLGAARLFGGWALRRERPTIRSLCPAALREQLWAVVQRQAIADNMDRFRTAFGLD